LRSNDSLEIAGCRSRDDIARRAAAARGAPLRRRARRQTVSTASTRAALMPRPGPAVPIERPPTVEEVIDELAPA
jgi:hypothetical protein